MADIAKIIQTDHGTYLHVSRSEWLHHGPQEEAPTRDSVLEGRDGDIVIPLANIAETDLRDLRVILGDIKGHPNNEN